MDDVVAEVKKQHDLTARILPLTDLRPFVDKQKAADLAVQREKMNARREELNMHLLRGLARGRNYIQHDTTGLAQELAELGYGYNKTTVYFNEAGRREHEEEIMANGCVGWMQCICLTMVVLTLLPRLF